MAPKDDSSKKQQPLYLQHPLVSFEDECSCASSSNTSQNEKQPRGWKQCLVIQIKRLLGEEEKAQDEDDSNHQLTKWGSTAIMAIAVFSVYKFARSRRVKQRLWPFVLVLFQKPDYHAAVQVSLSLLRSAAVQGIVTRALIGSSEIVFQDSQKIWKRSRLPPNSHNLHSDLLELLERHGCADVSTLPETLWSRLSGPLLTALPFVYLVMVYRIFKNIHGDDKKSNSKLLDSSSQTTRFTDVAGLDPIIGEVQDIVSYLRNPSYYLRVGAHPPRGILLHGPPGSGKTLLAQALAGEGKCDAFITCSGSDFCEMYVGRGKKHVELSLSAFQESSSNQLFFIQTPQALPESGPYLNELVLRRCVNTKEPPFGCLGMLLQAKRANRDRQLRLYSLTNWMLLPSPVHLEVRQVTMNGIRH